MNNPKGSKNVWNFLKLLLGISLIIILINKAGFNNLIELFSSIDPIFLIIAIFIQFIIFLLEAWNVHRLVKTINNGARYLRIFKYHLLSLCISFFTPGRLGQFSIIYLLKKEGLKTGEGTAISILDKIITMTSLSILSIIGFFVFFSFKEAMRVTFFLIIMGTVCLFLLTNNFGRKLIKKHILRRHAKKFEGFSTNLIFFYKSKKTTLFINFLINILKWTLTSIMMHFFFLSLGFQVNLLFIFLITPLSIIVSFIPISINGIGVRESTAVFLYALIGISNLAVVGAYLLNLSINYIIAALVIVLYLSEFKN